MKKILAIILALTMMTAILTACSDKEPAETSDDKSADVVISTSTDAESTENNNSTESTVSVEVSTPVSSDDTTEESSADASSADESSAVVDSSVDTSIDIDVPDDIQLSKTTYTVVLETNDEGVTTATAFFPAVDDIVSGKLVLGFGQELSYVSGSLKTSFQNFAANDKYPKFDREDLCISFATPTPVTEGTVVLTAQFIIAPGGTLSADDVFSPEWRMTNSKGESINEKTEDVLVIVK